MDDFELDTSVYKHSRTIIHIDIDCFYAQCEMLKNPELCNKPLGVKQKNYIITSNYIAREFGVKKCMLITEALSLCPQLVIVNGEDLYNYRKMSASVTEVIKEFTNKVEKLGFDENFVDISELVSSRLKVEIQNRSIEFEGHVYKNIVKNKCICGCNERLKLGSIIAKEIRDKIKEILKLTCSAGIGHNKLVAKLVSSEHKPDQQTTILPSALLTLMLSLSKVQSIPGIGRKTSAVLNKLNINNIVDIQHCPLHALEKHLGKRASEWILKSSFGIDDSEVKISGKAQTLSIEDAVKKITTIEDVQAKFTNLIERLLILIREDERLPTTLRITIRMAGSYTRESRQCIVNPNIVNSEKASRDILEIAMQLSRTVINQSKPFHLTLIGIGFTKFKDVYTGKKSIFSFFQKFRSCESVDGKESKEVDVIDSTITENTKNEIDYDLYKFENNFFQNTSQLQCCTQSSNIEITNSGEKSTSKSLKVFSLEENKSLVLQSLDMTRLDKSVLDELPNEIDTDTHSKNTETSEILNCPSGVDEEVFSQLPTDIQKELINNHILPIQKNTVAEQNKILTKTNSLNKLNIKSKVMNKKKSPKDQKNKIQNYFSKS